MSMSAQDRSWIENLVKDTSRDLYEQAVAIYEELGPSAVIEWGHRIGLRFDHCGPCEQETPTIGDVCAVCGTVRNLVDSSVV